MLPVDNRAGLWICHQVAPSRMWPKTPNPLICRAILQCQPEYPQVLVDSRLGFQAVPAHPSTIKHQEI